MKNDNRVESLKAFIAYTSVYKKEEDIRKNKMVMKEQLLPLVKEYFLAKGNMFRAALEQKDIPQEITKFVEQRICRLGIWEECSLFSAVDGDIRQKLVELSKECECTHLPDGGWEKFCFDTFIAKNNIEYLLKKFSYCFDERNASAAYKAQCLQQLEEQLVIAKEAYHEKYGTDYSRENLHDFVWQYAKTFDDCVWTACGYSTKFRYVFSNNTEAPYLTLTLERRDSSHPAIILSENINLSV